MPRVDGFEKVTGQARYTADISLDDLVYAFPVAASIGKGRILSIDDTEATAIDGVLAVLSFKNARKLNTEAAPTLAVFQDATVSYRGQFVAAVIATSPEQATAAADAVHIVYSAQQPDVMIAAGGPGLYEPRVVNGGHPARASHGDIEAAFADAAFTVDETYQTPVQHNCAIEPHASIASWSDGRLTVFDTCQGPTFARDFLASLFELPSSAVRVICEHVGGAFGAKGLPRANAVIAALGSAAVGRPVACLLTRAQTFISTGHRAATIQRLRLSADRSGNVSGIEHSSITYTSKVAEFVEQAAVVSRHMYAPSSRLSAHRAARLDVPTPSWMRAPGVCPGMFALESAMDELARRCGADPVEFRVRNLPGAAAAGAAGAAGAGAAPVIRRDLAACLRTGARDFGWRTGGTRPGADRRGRSLTGSGVASSVYPTEIAPSSAELRLTPAGRYLVRIAAADLGTGARTMLTIVAAEALSVHTDLIEVVLGDSDLPPAVVAGGSMGTASWSYAVVCACDALKRELATAPDGIPAAGLTVRVDTNPPTWQPDAPPGYAVGAQFAEVSVDLDSAEVRVTRLHGTFDLGRVLSPKTARSQLAGGMTMGLSMALHEGSAFDASTGGIVCPDLSGYHIATNLDVPDIEARWLPPADRQSGPQSGPMAATGLGEIGITGTAAAIANAVYHATGARIRSLPIRPDRLFPVLEKLEAAAPALTWTST